MDNRGVARTLIVLLVIGVLVGGGLYATGTINLVGGPDPEFIPITPAPVPALSPSPSPAQATPEATTVVTPYAAQTTEASPTASAPASASGHVLTVEAWWTVTSVYSDGTVVVDEQPRDIFQLFSQGMQEAIGDLGRSEKDLTELTFTLNMEFPQRVDVGDIAVTASVIGQRVDLGGQAAGSPVVILTLPTAVGTTKIVNSTVRLTADNILEVLAPDLQTSSGNGRYEVLLRLESNLNPVVHVGTTTFSGPVTLSPVKYPLVIASKATGESVVMSTGEASSGYSSVTNLVSVMPDSGKIFTDNLGITTTVKTDPSTGTIYVAPISSPTGNVVYGTPPPGYSGPIGGGYDPNTGTVGTFYFQ